MSAGEALGGVTAAEPWRVTPSGTGGGGDGDKAQGMAAEVESEVASNGEAVMPEMISLLVLAGAGDDSEPAASRARFS